MTNVSYLDYRMPTYLDLPMIEPVLVVPPPAALANAIYRAVGVRLRQLPMSPGQVAAALG